MDTQLNVLSIRRGFWECDFLKTTGPSPLYKPPPPCTAAAAAPSLEIVPAKLDEENPSTPILSGLLVQADEGIPSLVVDLIDDIYRRLPLENKTRDANRRAAAMCGGDHDVVHALWPARHHRTMEILTSRAGRATSAWWPDDVARCPAVGAALLAQVLRNVALRVAAGRASCCAAGRLLALWGDDGRPMYATGLHAKRCALVARCAARWCTMGRDCAALVAAARPYVARKICGAGRRPAAAPAMS
ncbi:hypothetical protein F511_41655 [Dorcoceras hygrometricum]|uniref:Uncharacterized protein n=1 Tax=Dorcoceras hygrometricum TaxID=472368 RepID=A0A2Z7CG88_9LAMI|nr:hypothetical protein F511_41655 [Dorcoceras hygrometricum]